MVSKIRLSIVGEPDRVSVSVHPVHSWKDSQITLGRLNFSRLAAIAEAMPGGKAIIEAVVVQNFRNARRDIPCCLKRSPIDMLSLILRLPVGTVVT